MSSMGALNLITCIFMFIMACDVWFWMRKEEKIIFAVIFLANAGYVVYDLFKLLS